MTMEASTTMPIPRIKPVKVMMFSVMFIKFIARRVMMIENGIEMEMMKVDLKLFKKTKRMRIARRIPCHALE